MQPGPQLVDLRLERGAVAGVVDHPVGGGQALLPADLAGDAGPGVGLGHAPLVDQALDGDLDRHVDDDRRRHPFRGCSARSGLSSTTTASVPCAASILPDQLDADGRVDDAR